ncbi:mitochondrial ribosomal protein [Pseudomassariella vexata]|uniref:Small ribosomal subunit protein mS29 n=1 Tax=Pseudomassariella vexata TaxID=1141098 RepID=A0A1Y2DED8_9PEZI|nr:mitochondrial ribosomal protein [Pseudomassariella vexata]ORY57464.1 mitochondrial ribosomal protein [Pseudomassariella vexata]
MTMASPNCWRCLARPSQRLLVPTSIAGPSTTAAFTTSAARFAGERKEAGGNPLSRHIRSGKKLILGKKRHKGDKSSGKSVGEGERKAFRKRITLSNNNALDVPGLDEITAENMTDQAAVGQVMGIPEEVIDQLRIVEAFKPTQQWGLFRRPHMLIRRETVDFVKAMTETVARKGTFRSVVTGPRGSGKSMLGLQALCAGFLNKYVVINIPEAQDIVNAHTEYATIPNTNMFSQPVYLIKLMQDMYATNKEVLSKQQVGLDHMHLPISVPRGWSLAQLASATKEPEFAWPVFQALWKELLLPGRPPIMFSLDGLSHIMRPSDYRSPSFELIHSHDLSLIRLFVDALGGKTHFANGASIVGIMTKGNSLKIKSLEKALEQAAAAQAGLKIPPRDPFYSKYDEKVFESLKGVGIFEVNGVSKAEARALMEYWAASGILRMRIDEKNVSERWTLAGNGVLGEMERASLFPLRL